MDWTRVNELREEVGAEAFSEVLALFLEETDGMAQQLAASVSQGLLAALLA